MKRKTVGYIRVSPAKQTDFLTLETQEEGIRKACVSRRWPLRKRAPIVVDKEKHSDDLKRTGLETLLDEVEEGKIGRIVVYAHDRLARGDLLPYLLRFLMAYKVKVFFLDLPEYDDNTEFLYDSIASQGKYFLKVLRKRTAAGMQTALEKGHKVGRPPCGFTVKDKLEWVPKDLSLTIERYHQQGLSEAEIRDLGLKYPDGKNKGKSITLTHVRCVIKRMSLWRSGELVEYLLKSKGPRKKEFLTLLEERARTRKNAIIELQQRIPYKVERRSL